MMHMFMYLFLIISHWFAWLKEHPNCQSQLVQPKNGRHSRCLVYTRNIYIYIFICIYIYIYLYLHIYIYVCVDQIVLSVWQSKKKQQPIKNWRIKAIWGRVVGVFFWTARLTGKLEVCVCVYIYIHMWLYKKVWDSVEVFAIFNSIYCICIYIYIFIFIFTFMFVYIYIKTYNQTI